MESFYHAMKAHCTYDLTAFSTFKNKMIHTPYRNYNNISIQKIWKQTVFSVFDSNTALRETQTSDQKFFNLNPRNNSALISSIFWSFRKKKIRIHSNFANVWLYLYFRHRPPIQFEFQVHSIWADLRRSCECPCPQFGRCSDICVWLFRISKHSSLHSYHITFRNPNVSNQNFSQFPILHFFPDHLIIFTRKCHDSWRQVVCRYSFTWTTYI